MSEAERGPSSAAAAEAQGGFSSGVVSIPLPRIFGRLLLLKLVARGGMGDVYLAATTGIEGAERPIVVKTVRRDHIHDGSFLARFLDEARVQSQLNHPGVVQILEASTDENGEPYTVVEHVEGRSLADVRHRAVQVGARIGWAEAAAITIEMGQALAHVHERAGADGTPLGIVHRDLSPQNVMVGYAGEVKLIDFGTARGHNRRCHTVAGVVFAKPGYVAPEVARQQVGDGRIDVYAMGVMLWELCAGKRLLTGEAQKHLEEVAAGRFDIPLLAPTRGIPKELDEIIQKLCANDPDDRYSSAGHAATDLARVLAQAPAGKSGERSVRARVAALMKTLWPHEPARSRAEFAKLLKQARELRRPEETPPASGVMEAAAAQMVADPAILAGTSYRLLEKIGEGASGEVFKAEHIELGRKYAVKVLSSAHAAAHDAVERFRREARAVAKLSHPNLVQLHDFGKSLDGRVFLVMELLAGSTLDIHAEKGIGWREAIRLSIQATRALEAAHHAGVVHRDLKPQNLFLTKDGDLKLLDFGVAMALADTGEERKQKGFAVFGTPEYMAPEQVAGETVDARCDIYALGCVLYEMVTGTRPFEGSPVVVMGKQLREEPERPRTRAPNALIPGELEGVIMKALAKSKSDRYTNAKEMREALEEALAAPDRRRGRARSLAGLLVVGSIALLAAAGLKGRISTAPVTAMWSKMTAAKETPVAVATLNVGELPAASPPAPAPAPEAPAVAPPAEPPPASAEPPPPATVAVAEPAPAAAKEAHKEDPKEARKDDPKAVHTEPHLANAKKPNPLLVKASARSSEVEGERSKLTDARAHAHEHANDPKALKAWATAAMHAGEMREARRAAEAWAVHDGTAEPRMFLAATLEASGRKREARAVLEEWLANHPDSTDAKRMLSRLGGSPEPAIKRGSRSRAGRVQLHPPDPVAGEE
ncbi:MAG: serine/threonine protein kinase [Deltaproteobacteria bacterium]|nr:serine/threonine protein kinase [Deltaproteobacteria bacterium]